MPDLGDACGFQRERQRQSLGTALKSIFAVVAKNHVPGESLPRDTLMLNKPVNSHAVPNEGSDHFAEPVIPFVTRGRGELVIRLNVCAWFVPDEGVRLLEIGVVDHDFFAIAVVDGAPHWMSFANK